jgi:hypothetical protein
MYNFEKKSPINVKISFWHISVHGGHIGKTNYKIKGLPNIKSIDGMVYKKYKYEFGPQALFSPFLWSCVQREIFNFYIKKIIRFKNVNFQWCHHRKGLKSALGPNSYLYFLYTIPSILLIFGNPLQNGTIDHICSHFSLYLGQYNMFKYMNYWKMSPKLRDYQILRV